MPEFMEAVEVQKRTAVGNLEPEALSKLARDIFEGKVFASRHIADGDDDQVTSIFMPLGLGGLAGATQEYIDDIGMVYEYLRNAGPLSVNGYHTFFSCHFLSKHDDRIVCEKVAKIREAVEAALR